MIEFSCCIYYFATSFSKYHWITSHILDHYSMTFYSLFYHQSKITLIYHKLLKLSFLLYHISISEQQLNFYCSPKLKTATLTLIDLNQSLVIFY